LDAKEAHFGGATVDRKGALKAPTMEAVDAVSGKISVSIPHASAAVIYLQ
jgi:hypothetical protein